jgi:hypothetical protein
LANVDPFTRIHQAIWGALAGHPPWAQLVLAGNRQDMTNTLFQQPLADVQAGDLPGAVIWQDEFVMQPLGATGLTADFEQDYTLLLSTDVMSVVPVNQLKFQTAVALLKAGIDLGLGGIVRDWAIRSARDSSRNKQTNASARWTAALTIGVRFYFPRSTLLAM